MKLFNPFTSLVILLLFKINFCSGQINKKEELRKNLNRITASHHATIGMAAIHIETGDTITLNNNFHFPMQSVYKFPLAMAVLNQVDKKEIKLTETMYITSADLLPQTWSPLKMKYPDGNVNISVADLLYYSVSQSDNVACDMLFKLMKGPSEVNKYIQEIGYQEIEIVSTEDEMHKDIMLQYKNWCKPMTMSFLLKGVYEKKHLSDSSNNYLMRLMTESSNPANRIKGMLPPKTIVAHKTGTGGENDKGIRSACNDVGIITFPNNKHLILSVFVSKSSDKFESDEKVIAEIAKCLYDYYKDR